MKIKNRSKVNDSLSPQEVLFFNYLKISHFFQLLGILKDYQKIDDWNSSWQPKSEQSNRFVAAYSSYLTLFPQCL